MHSNIYSIITINNEKETLKEVLNNINIMSDDTLADSLYEDGHRFFDYIAQRDNFKEDIDWLKDCYEEALSFSTEGLPEHVVAVTITKKSLDTYYAKKTGRIEEFIDSEGIRPEDDMWCYRIKNLIECTNGGFYFYNAHGDWYYECSTMDEFFHQTLNYFNYYKNDEITFYIVEVYDYHN